MLLAAFLRFFALLALWLILAGPVVQVVWFGVPAAALAAALSLRLHPPSRPSLHPLGALAALPRLLVLGVIAGFDIALRALSPRLPVAPGWVRLPLRRRDGPYQVFLGGIISVLPGTLSAGPGRDEQRVHLLNAEASALDELERLQDWVQAAVANPEDQAP